jgi:transposase
MRAYSVDLRERVLAALDRGMARAEAVTTFAVSLSTIKRWGQLRRAGVSLTPRRSPGRSPCLTATALAELRMRLVAAPDATLDAHTTWWNEHHAEHPVSRATLDRGITRLGWSRKKRRSGPASEMTRRVPPSRRV